MMSMNVRVVNPSWRNRDWYWSGVFLYRTITLPSPNFELCLHSRLLNCRWIYRMVSLDSNLLTTNSNASSTYCRVTDWDEGVNSRVISRLSSECPNKTFYWLSDVLHGSFILYQPMNPSPLQPTRKSCETLNLFISVWYCFFYSTQYLSRHWPSVCTSSFPYGISAPLSLRT